MKITDRLDLLVQARKPDIDIRRIKRDIADACGVSYEAVRRWYSGNTENLRNDNLIAIARKYDTTIDWLLTGTGAPPRRDAGVLDVQAWAASVQASLSKLATPITIEAVNTALDKLKSTAHQSTGVGETISLNPYDFDRLVPDVPVPSGYNTALTSLAINKSFLKERGIACSDSARLAIVMQWDDGMSGTLNARDVAIVDYGIRAFNGDGIYMFTWAGHLFIRRLQLASHDQIELLADNPTHKPRTVSMADVGIYGRVLLGLGIQKL